MTGGGSPSIILDAFEEKILSLIGDAAVTGVKSGVDSEGKQLSLTLSRANIQITVFYYSHTSNL